MLTEQQIAKLSKRITETFGTAFSDVASRVGELLTTAAEKNEADEQQTSRSQVTISPKILITFVAPNGFDVEVRVPVKQTVQVIGQTDAEFSIEPDGSETVEEDLFE